MTHPQFALNCSCGGTMRAIVSPPRRVADIEPNVVKLFLAFHDGPEHIVTDRDGVVVPPPAVVEVRRAGGPELPGFDEVATKPEDRYPS